MDGCLGTSTDHIGGALLTHKDVGSIIFELNFFVLSFSLVVHILSLSFDSKILQCRFSVWFLVFLLLFLWVKTGPKIAYS